MKKVANRFIAVALLLAFSLTTVGCGAKVNKGTSDSESGVTSESTGTAINDNSNPQDDNVPGNGDDTTSVPNNTSGENSQTSNNNNNNNKDSTQANSNYNEPKFNLKGREIVIASEHTAKYVQVYHFQ